MEKNIEYTSKELLEFYSRHRQTWNEFYLSERTVFERVAEKQGSFGHILDVGCAGGGLGRALSERFQLRSYTGIDIHEGIIAWAREHRKLPVSSEFHFTI